MANQKTSNKKEDITGGERDFCGVCKTWRTGCRKAETIYGETVCVCSRCLIERGDERDVQLVRKAIEKAKVKK